MISSYLNIIAEFSVLLDVCLNSTGIISLSQGQNKLPFKELAESSNKSEQTQLEETHICWVIQHVHVMYSNTMNWLWSQLQSIWTVHQEQREVVAR